MGLLHCCNKRFEIGKEQIIITDDKDQKRYSECDQEYEIYQYG